HEPALETIERRLGLEGDGDEGVERVGLLGLVVLYRTVVPSVGLGLLHLVDDALDAGPEEAAVVERVARGEQTERHSRERGVHARLVEREPAHARQGDVRQERADVLALHYVRREQ